MINIAELINAFDMKNVSRNFNPTIRDDFIKMHASKLPPKTKMIDVSSGNKPYKESFSHCEYLSHEFGGNSNILDTFRGEKNKKFDHDIYSPIDAIPVSDDEFDFVLCSEVFEHIPEPILAMKELVRICKPGGKILITAPFTSGVHQEPYHFYSGFSPFFYNFLKEKYNLNIIDFKSQGDMFLLQNQEIGRVLSHRHPIISNNPKLNTAYNYIREFLSIYTLHLSKLHEKTLNFYNTPDKMLQFYNNCNQFTIGYCVLFEKK